MRAALLVLLLWTAAARAQTGASPAAAPREGLLTRIGRTADDLDHHLPNFSCEEAGTSDEVQHGKVKHHVKFTTTVRAQRNSKGVLEEQNGKIEGNVGFFQAIRYGTHSIPLFLAGGFSQALDYFLPDAQHCFAYQFSHSDARIDFHSLRPAPDGCHQPNLAGFALVDPSGDITHVERTVTFEPGAPRNVITYAAIDFAPVELNGHLFRLSQHVVGEEPGDDGETRRFTADYTHCQLFTATITMHSGEPPAPEPDPHP